MSETKIFNILFVAFLLMALTISVTGAVLYIERQTGYVIGIYPPTGKVIIYPYLNCDEDEGEYQICVRRGDDGKRAFEKLEQIMGPRR